MGYAERIVKKFGGIRPMAAAMAIAPTTVQGWKDSGSIPDKHKNAVIAKAAELGISLALTDFFDVVPESLTTANDQSDQKAS